MAIRNASAHWTGTLTEGQGKVRTGKGGYEGPYSFSSRFEEGEGTNPEELIGAAHAGCFSMFLAKLLADAGFPPLSVETEAKVHLEKTDAGQTVTKIELSTVGQATGIDEAEFQKHAETAKANCPISRLLAPGTEIALTARLG
ncbi:OsmC family protein [Natronosporangium hydrolyticum]|uniref:OsmC family protein n=1 Tax=Natronosporangium hydrolyticum TaxID=2811111 RepID=A0A895YB02_9ACTN|nr:OsmC family protein [Natronosporangium hydrolyticum]QSB14954.1 OsmC family protein [Natronosporangium hydrolyticum]